MTTDGQFAVTNWTNVLAEEMVQFVGVILKLSINNRELGGYASYFTNQKSLSLAQRYFVELNDCTGWAVQVMSL